VREAYYSPLCGAEVNQRNYFYTSPRPPNRYMSSGRVQDCKVQERKNWRIICGYEYYSVTVQSVQCFSL